MLKIVTDGSVDMPPNWKGEYEIDVIPLYVRFGETSYMPGVNLNTAEFYELVQQNGIVPKTSLPSPDQIAVFYRKIAQKEDEILSVHLGSKLSGTFSTVQVAAKELEHEFKIYPFDSEAGSAALGFMCKEARVLSRAGLPLPGIIQRLEDIRSRVMIILTVDNLEFARLSGRVNAIQSTLSSVLRIKPIIILRNGLLEVEEKARTRQRAIERIIGYVSERIGNRLANIAVVHAEDQETAGAIAARLRQTLNIQELILADLSVVVAAHLGPGTVGIVAYPVGSVE